MGKSLGHSPVGIFQMFVGGFIILIGLGLCMNVPVAGLLVIGVGALFFIIGRDDNN